MKCLDGPLQYIGQTERTFNIRYKEHIHAIRNNSNNSGYSKHLLNSEHAYRNNNRYHGCHKGRKEEQTFECLGKISHL
jgi:hypothetical protein